MDKKISIAVLITGLLFGAAIIKAQSVGMGNSSILLKRDSSTGLFLLTINDPQGIKEFSLQPSGKSSYGGGITQCPRTFQNNNVLFTLDDFTPDMNAYVLDCAGNRDEFKVGPPKDGITSGVRTGKAAPAEEKVTTPVKEIPTVQAPAGGAPGEAKEAARRAKKLEVIAYPVAELGNCSSEAACRVFCDDVANIRTCVAFAEKQGLISKEEANTAKRFADIAKNERPGGCTSQDSCTAYCENVAHIDECVAFAERYGFLSADELQEARTVLKLKKDGVSFPGGCTGKAQCEAYCTEASHTEECITFAEKSGLIPPAELKQAKKILPLIQQGKTPGGCKTKAQCESYCTESAHIRQCLAFAEENNLLPKEELEMAKKFLPLMEQGKTPGGCKTKEQCESYCGESSHVKECISFAEEAGVISKADAEIARKTGGKGPGDCRSKEECETFCKNPQNLKTCEAFAREHGIETQGPGGCRNVEECRDYCHEPAHQKNCESFAKERGLEITGPGGCQGKEQCAAYCQAKEHGDECKAFFKEQGIEFNGPGGCKSLAECESYCRAPEHLKECASFTGGEGGEAPTGGGGGPSGYGSGDGFLACGIIKGAVAAYVCGINGKNSPAGVETTYFNECHAKQHSAQILHGGVCVRKGGPDKPCSDVAEPVCGSDGASYTHKCYAKERGAGVKHEGVCTSEDHGGGGGTGGGSVGGPSGGPGGCRTQAECAAYCQTHYTDPACGGTPPPPLGGGSTGGGAVCDYAQPPAGCTLIPGPNYNSQTHCGLELSCPTTKPPTPTPTPAPAQSCALTPSGLVTWLNGESPSGAVGGVTIVPGKVGNAFKFDGSSGYINMGNPANLNFGTGPFSLEAWFNWTGEGAGQVVNNIIRKSNYGPGAGSGYWLRIGQQLEFSVGATTQSEGQILITAPISSGAWHHAVGTKDSSGNMQLYVDGQSRGTIVRQAANTQSTSESSFAIGAWPDQYSEFFHGIIDEISVYNRALSASEVQAIFNAGSAGKCSASSGSAQP